MRKIFNFALIALCLSAVYSCEKEIAVADEIQTQDVLLPNVYTCTIAGLDTKVTVAEDGKTAWEDGDKLLIHGQKVEDNLEVELHSFTNGNKDASFTADLSSIAAASGSYYAAYPADAYIGLTDEPGYNGYYSGFGNTNKPLLAGYLDGSTFKLYNLCGVLTFKVSGDYDGYLFEGNRAETVGYDEYRVKITSEEQNFNSWKTAGDKASITGTVNGDGSTLNYVYFPNGASFPNGFTLYLMKEGVIKGYVTSNKSIDIERGHQKNMGVLPAGKIHARPMASWTAGAIDLNNQNGAKQAPANSYLLVRNSTYRDKVFKIRAVKGNDLTQPIEGIASVEILWESRCNDADTAPDPGFLVESVDFDKNHIYLKTPAGDAFKDGNALIAAKDSEGNILWSWHIWVSNTAVTDITSPAVSNTPVMDRNLGALVPATIDAESKVTSYGLVYQWGRKDPFLGAKRVTSSTTTVHASAAGRTFTVGPDEYITLDYSIKNPMAMPATPSYDKDWCSDTDNNFWKDSAKTIYDPCPSGYRVMQMDKSTELWSDDNQADITVVTGWAYNVSNYSFAFGSPAVIFPLAGYKEAKTKQTNPGTRAGVWCTHLSSSHPEQAYYLNIRVSGDAIGTHARNYIGRYRALSVRCEREP